MANQESADQCAGIAETFTAPPGSQLVQLRPDCGYVLQFERPTTFQECEGLMQLWSGMSLAGFAGPLILLPMGIKFGTVQDYMAAQGA